MNHRSAMEDRRDLHLLLRVGTISGLSDGQLLERFATRCGESSELAFRVLVERHGPMVSRTCLSLLGDEHDAQDAFQATFLALAQRGDSLWVRDSVGPWLHRVACRAAALVRRQAARRRSAERAAVPKPPPAPGDGLAEVINEEIDRLPERFRVPVLLCDLEGCSHEEAARAIGCPVGTVKSRLARGRARLRAGLTRRGVAPAALGLAVAAGLGVVPDAWARDVVGAVSAADAASAGSARVLVLTREVLKTMLVTRLLRVASAALAFPILALVAFAAAAGPPPGRSDVPPAAVAASKGEPVPEGLFAPRAWQSDPYRPPDYSGFFLDDPEAARVLAALWDEVKPEMTRQYMPGYTGPQDWYLAKNRLTGDELLRTVRRGLRGLDEDRRCWVLRWIGFRFVPEKGPSNPDAVEILYHAMDYRDDRHYENPTRRFAQGPCSLRVRPLTPSLRRALVELAMRDDTPDTLSNICGILWIDPGPDGKAEAFAELKPYLVSDDAAVREKAQAVERMFQGELSSWTWATEPARRRAQQRYGPRLAEIRAALTSGTSAERLRTLKFLFAEKIVLILDDSFLDPLRACASDPDDDVREFALGLAVEPWLDRLRNEPPGVDLVAGFLKDRSHDVRVRAVGYVLRRKGALPEPVVRALVEAIILSSVGDPIAGENEIRECVRANRDEVLKVLADCLRDPVLAGHARAWYRKIVEVDPPPVAVSGGPYTKALADLYQFLGNAYPNFELKGIDWTAVGRELLPRAAAVQTEGEFGLLVEELVARLEDSHAIVVPGTAKPPVPDLPRWDPGLACLIDDRGRPVVYHVDPGSPAERAGIAPGTIITKVDGLGAVEAIDRWMRRQRRWIGYSSDRLLRADAAWGFVRRDARGDRLELTLEGPDGGAKAVEVAADLGPRYLLRRPVPRPGIDDSADVSWTKLDGRVGYISVRRIREGLEGNLDRGLRELGEIRGLILDVRGNGGGGFDTATAFVNFDPAPAAGGSERPRYTGPIALLLDDRTISAGEGWASWFVARKRARTFGTTTAGASSRKVTYDLTNGLYKVVVPVKAYTGFLDRPIERQGLAPDVEVRCAASDLSRGKDTVVESAAEWLRQAGRD